jgi:hypothetical protein
MVIIYRTEKDIFMKFLYISILFFFIGSINAQELSQRTLEKAEVIQGTSFKKGTVVQQDANKYLFKAVLAEDQPIADLVIGKIFPHIFPKGSEVIYNEPIDMFGKPRMNPFLPEKVIVASKMKIFDVSIAPQTEVMVFGGTMTENKKVSYFAEVTIVLLEDVKIKGKNIPKGSYIKIESKKNIQVSKDGGWQDI